MNFLRRYWYNLGLLAAVTGLGVVLLGDLSRVQQILLLNFVVLVLHQFEEYGWPGGGPWVMNQVLQPSDRPDRYPVNRNNAMVINVFCAYPFYLLPVFFPQTIWLGLPPVLFAFGQFIVHGVITNWKLKGFYNPGLAAVVLGHIPIGIWYLVEINARGVVHTSDWVLAILYLIAFIAIIMQWLGYKVLVNKNSPYPFSPEEMARFDRDRRLARIGRSAHRPQ